MTAPDAWFRAEIERGLIGLAVLSLDGTPAGELLEGGAVAATWTGALFPTRAWDIDRDRPRMRAAFRTLAATVTRWPAPAHVIAALPSPRPAVSLPAPPRGAERDAAARAALAALGAKLGWDRGAQRVERDAEGGE